MQNEGAGEVELAHSLATSVFGVEEEVLQNDLKEMFGEMVSEQILLEEQA
jgi:hypothetical protein